MAKTFTEQVNLPPASAAWDADGEGMHTAYSYDLVRGLNNLGTYVNNHAHYVQGSSSTTATADGAVTHSADAGEELFMLQIPILVPLWAKRLVWTVGAKPATGTLSTVTLYLAKTPYTGNVVDAFSTANLTAGYKSRAVTVSLSAGTYGIADDSSTGVTPIDSDTCSDINAGIGWHTKRLTYGIVTATAGTTASIQVYDSSFWFLPS